MIRIRSFGPGELIHNGFRAARYTPAFHRSNTGLMLPSVFFIMEREHGAVQLDVIDREHSGCLHQTGGFTMDDRLRKVIPMNPFNPLMSGWEYAFGVRQQGSLALQAVKVPEHGRMVREHIAQAPRMKEQAEHTLRVSMALEEEVVGWSAQRNVTKNSTLFLEKPCSKSYGSANSRDC